MRPLSDGERIATLEQQMRDMRDDVREMRGDVRDIHNVIMQAKGARWAILALASLAGLLAGLSPKILSFLGIGPR